MKNNNRLSLYRQENMVEKLLKFRLRDYKFSSVKVECYNRFDGDATMCRVEVFRGGKGIKNRVMKYEARLDEFLVSEVERQLGTLIQ
ncbi:hypothetical protein [Pareuzebyella sediminis]|uniref:hypothetical protein n=1 Tax=Pareuzebyella sediminis TaxID=2607998 RepID=UPI0011F08349|nr:hypothetical protein [Pareuzebyella sediminis]